MKFIYFFFQYFATAANDSRRTQCDRCRTTYGIRAIAFFSVSILKKINCALSFRMCGDNDLHFTVINYWTNWTQLYILWKTRFSSFICAVAHGPRFQYYYERLWTFRMVHCAYANWGTWGYSILKWYEWSECVRRTRLFRCEWRMKWISSKNMERSNAWTYAEKCCYTFVALVVVLCSHTLSKLQFNCLIYEKTILGVALPFNSAHDGGSSSNREEKKAHNCMAKRLALQCMSCERPPTPSP